MDLAVSGFAWPPGQEAAALALLRRGGIGAIEVVPTRLVPESGDGVANGAANWAALTPAVLAAARARFAAHGLGIAAVQSLFHGLPGTPQLFGPAGEFARLAAHLRRVAEIAGQLGAPLAVLGAARNRAAAPAHPDLALARLHGLAEAAAGAGLVLVLEPVPEALGCRFATTAAEALRLVRAVGHPALRLQVDTANAHLAGEDLAPVIAAAGPLLAHVHVAQPGLGAFADPLPGHARAAAALRAGGYRGRVTLELLDHGPDPLADLAGAIAAGRRLYAS